MPLRMAYNIFASRLIICLRGSKRTSVSFASDLFFLSSAALAASSMVALGDYLRCHRHRRAIEDGI